MTLMMIPYTDYGHPRQCRHKSKKPEIVGRCGRQNMLRPYLKIWEWEWIFGRAVKAISSLGVRRPWSEQFWLTKYLFFSKSMSIFCTLFDHNLLRQTILLFFCFFITLVWARIVFVELELCCNILAEHRGAIHLTTFWQEIVKYLRFGKLEKWYFVRKIVLAYCAKSLSGDPEKVLNFGDQEFAIFFEITRSICDKWEIRIIFETECCFNLFLDTSEI